MSKEKNIAPNYKQDKALKAEKEWLSLEGYGVVMYGSTWQTEMAKDLKLKNSSHLRAWKKRGVPKRVWGLVKKLAENKMIKIEVEVINKIK